MNVAIRFVAFVTFYKLGNACTLQLIGITDYGNHEALVLRGDNWRAATCRMAVRAKQDFRLILALLHKHNMFKKTTGLTCNYMSLQV